MKKKLLFFMLSLSMAGYAQFSTESFETPWGGNTPEGWAVYQNNQDTSIHWEQGGLVSNGVPAYTGDHAAYITGNVPETGVVQDWIVRTHAEHLGSNMELRFYSMFANLSPDNPVCRIMICPSMYDPSDLSNYTLVQEIIPTAEEYSEVVVPMPEGIVGVQYYIAFVYESLPENNSNTWIIDDVSLVLVCMEPMSLMATNITSSSATLTWDAWDAQQWEIEVLPVTALPTGIGELVNNTTYEVTDLTIGDYKFYVRGICGEDYYSTWAGPFYFSTMNGIAGIVRYDSDDDGDCDADDIAVPSTQIEVSYGSETYSVYTNENGEYALYGMPNDVTEVTLQVVAPNGLDPMPAVIEEVNFISNPVAEINLCLEEANPVQDLSISIVPVNPARPGLEAHYDIVVRNMGTAVIPVATAVIDFNNERLDFISGGTITGMGNSIEFTVDNMQPFSIHHFDVVFLVMAPPENIGGEILDFLGGVFPMGSDIDFYDNTVELHQTIMNSFDPNDITVHQGATIYEDQTEDYLHYTIRFQNTGTAEAIDIRLENELDEKLDWNTFEPIASSHGYSVTRNASHVEFLYHDINLPHEASDEPGSHGFVTYRVKPKSTYGLGDIVYNTAGIFFDFNPAIITNTVSTQVIERPLIGINDNTMQNVAIYPNPVKDRLTVQTANEKVSLIEVYDINGRLCLSQSNGTNVNVQSLNNGLYFVKVTTEKGMITKKIVKQ